MLLVTSYTPLLAIYSVCFCLLSPCYRASCFILPSNGDKWRWEKRSIGSKSQICPLGRRCSDWFKERFNPKFVLSFSANEQMSNHHSNNTAKERVVFPDEVDNDGLMEEEEEDSMFDDYCDIVDDFGCQAFEEMLKMEQEGGGDKDSRVTRWVRIEAKADETILAVNTMEDVYAKINDAREIQASYGPAELYERHWESSKTNNLCQMANGEKNNQTFHIMQFNALAEGLSSGDSVKTPFPVPGHHRESQGFGGFTSILQPSVALDFSLRRWRLIEVILGGSIKDFPRASFDIVALQEIDRFRGFFAPILRIFGYQGIFMPKARAPGVRLGWYSDGCALFWKSDSFDLVSERGLVYRIGTQVMVLVVLRHRVSKRCILVAVTHLKAQKNEQNEKIRCLQVDELLEHVNEATDRLIRQGENVTALIMGDFNSEPPCQLSGESSVRRVLEPSNNGLDFQSAYEIHPPSSDFFTSWKTRGDKTTKRVIDYIVYSAGMKCSARLSVPKEKEMEKAKLPGLRFPSDHMMIAAEFELD